MTPNIAAWNAEATERLRASLQRQHATEVEALKADLRVAAHEREVRISKLAEKRAEVIEETHSLLVKTHQAFIELMAPLRYEDQSAREDLVQPAMDAANEFNEYAGEHTIYFDDKLAKRLHEVIHELRDNLDRLPRRRRGVSQVRT